MLTCQDVTELVTEYVEGRMPFWRRMQFHMHIGMCKHCRTYLAQMRQTVAALGDLPPDPIPEDIKEALLKRLRAMSPPDSE